MAIYVSNSTVKKYTRTLMEHKPLHLLQFQPIQPEQSTRSFFLRSGNTNNFDTLYDFNAYPGNKWLLPDAVPASGCNRHIVTVLDTGHRTINSTNLRWLKVSIFDNIQLVNDTIFERIGFKQYFYFAHYICPIPPAADPPFVTSLRCYSDYQINYKLYSACVSIFLHGTSIEENSVLNSVSIYPNPSENKIFVDYNLQEMNPVKLVITNYLGQVVYETENVLPNQETDLHTLEKGFYFFTIQSGKRQKTFKIIKE